MDDLRAGWQAAAKLALVMLVGACSSPAPQQRAEAAELANLASLKQQYPEVVMGFDIQPENTLVVSLDLQHYIEMDDDVVAAMKRNSLSRWRSAWSAAHPHVHALLHVRFIDFIGRKVAEESTKT
jgi:hypothetical protein